MKRFILTLFAAFSMILGANAQSKIAHINSSELMSVMPEMKDFETKMKNYETELRNQLESMQKELQENYLQWTQDTVSSEVVMQIKKKKMEDLQATIQEFSQNAEQSMQKKKEELYLPIYNKAKNAINEVAKARGFDYVLDSSEGLGVIVALSGNDLLNDVKKKLGII
jgi:outer membrane protein